METLLVIVLGPIAGVIIGTVVYCAGAVAIEVATAPIALAEDIIENRKKNK